MYKSSKRVLDFLFAFLGVLSLFPIFLLLFIILYFSNNGKPFFTQARPGKNEHIFNIVKFKSMNDKRDASGNLLSNEERLTQVGKFIRKTSLDEIPQLFNVLKGDMSFIGPRPLKVEYLKLYSKEQRRRHHVKPGISGWAQVNGRNAISHTEKFKLDVWYVDNQGFLLDLMILFKTIKKVFRREGVGVNGVNNNGPFNGSN